MSHKSVSFRGKKFFSQTRRERRAYPEVDLQGIGDTKLSERFRWFMERGHGAIRIAWQWQFPPADSKKSGVAVPEKSPTPPSVTSKLVTSIT